MATKLTDHDIKKLLKDPVAWARNQHMNKARMVEDEQFRHAQAMQDVYYHHTQKLKRAHDILVEKGVINEGDPSPWLVHE